MERLIQMIMRIAFWAVTLAVIGVVGTAMYQVFIGGTSLKSAFSPDEIWKAGTIGLVAGGVIGFFKKR